jgi:hypothetical protein
MIDHVGTIRVKFDYILLSVGFLGLTVAAINSRNLAARLETARTPLAGMLSASVWTRDSRPHVLFIFRPGDCPRSLQVIEVLNTLHDGKSAVVEGLLEADTLSPALFRELATAYKIRFPVRAGHVAQFADRLNALGVVDLPVTLVFDSRRVIRAVAPGSAIGDEELRTVLLRTLQMAN